MVTFSYEEDDKYLFVLRMSRLWFVPNVEKKHILPKLLINFSDLQEMNLSL